MRIPKKKENYYHILR